MNKILNFTKPLIDVVMLVDGSDSFGNKGKKIDSLWIIDH